ncbi:MAG: hypothetical protein WC915_03950 [archaeon]|jgi:hypothetical protein
MKTNQGFIQTILIIVIVLVILGYFGFNIESILQSSTVKTNLAWLWDILVTIWSYVSVPILYLWNLAVSLWNAGLANLPAN